MSAESNKQALATALAAWNAGNLTRYADLYDSNAVIHGLAPTPLAKEQAIAIYAGMHQAFPGVQIETLALIAEGEQLAVHFRMSGVHRGDFAGMPATGKSFSIDGMTFLRFAGGKATERYTLADMAGLLAQFQG